MKQNIMITLLIVAIATGGAGFFAGTKYQQSKQQTFTRQFGNGQGQRLFGGQAGQNGTARGGIRPVAGEIIKADDTSITVKLTDGSSKIVMITSTTEINKAEKGAITDLTTGTKVAVFGSENSDGSITAQNIQLNPNTMRMGSTTPNQSAKSADAREIVVQGNEFSFSPSTISVKKGEKIRILLKNVGNMTHDFVVDELNVRTAIIGGSQEDFVEFTPDKTGTFAFYCSIGNHRAMGMKGTITVQ